MRTNIYPGPPCIAYLDKIYYISYFSQTTFVENLFIINVFSIP